MPLFDFKCEKCGKEKGDVMVRASLDTLQCPSCGGSMIKQVGKASFVLKGDSWAKDGYK